MENASTSVIFPASIQEQIRQVEALMAVQADDHHPDLAIALRHLLSSGGKRVRPAICLLVGKILGGQPERLVRLGAAIELLHTATLVHDDLIDGSLLRRGIATLNAQWSPAATVLTGDFIFAQAARLAASADSTPVMRMFAETLAIIVSGEITQLFSSPGMASRDNYYQRIHAKTASLFELAAAAAALLSPVDQDTVATMQRFGYNIGMAFQIIDDILDFTGEQNAIGKPVASDLRHGLITLPALYYLDAHPEDPALQQILHGQAPEKAAMDCLVQDIRSSGAIQQSVEEARKYAELGITLLAPLPDSAERRALQETTRYFINRNV